MTFNEDIMRAKITGQRGMSLVEATIILMVLAILTSVIAPSMGDYVNEARNTKAKEDVEAIGTAIIRMVRDTGLRCLSRDTATPCNLANRVELLVSGSAVGSNEPKVVSADYVPTAGTSSNDTGLNWAGATNEVADASRALMTDQFVSNTLAGTDYTPVSFTGGGGPRAGIGWRGAYLTGPVDVDPWGFMYQANTVFMNVASNAAAGSSAEGELSFGYHSDVIVLSSGSNGTVQTAFGSAGSPFGSTAATGDDVIYTVKGATR